MKILIVVDMQNDFIDGSLGTPEAKAIVDKVCNKIRKAHLDSAIIYATHDTHLESYLQTLEGRNLPVEHCIVGTDGWKLNDDVYTALKEGKYQTIIKYGFGSVDLMSCIQADARHNDIDEIEFVGLCTDVCVISNAIMARTYFPDIVVSIDSECCAGVYPESHKVALDAAAMCQITIK